MIIDIKEKLVKRNLPRPLQVLSNMPSEDADDIIQFILNVIVGKVRIGLGLIDTSEDYPLKFFDEIHKVYKEYYGGCYFCDNEIDEIDENSEICIICHRKLVNLLEFRSQQIENSKK